MTDRSCRRLVWILPCAFLFVGCATAPPRQTDYMTTVGGIEMSSRELQLRLYAFATDFAGAVEQTADAIHQASDDREVCENAILWKLHAVPALHHQIFQEDPLIGCINAYALCALMQQYFSDVGAGRDAFGDWQDLARATTNSLRDDMEDLMAQIKDDAAVERLLAEVAGYVAEYPLQDLTFGRRSAMNSMASLASVMGPSGLAAAAAMNEQMRALNDRLAIYAEYVPKHVRWQTDLMTERFPELADEQRAAAIADARTEAIAAWEVVGRTIEEQRAATMADLGRERAAVMAGLAEERQAALDALSGEREIVLLAMQQEREAILTSIEALTRETLETLERSASSNTATALDSTFAQLRIVLILIFVGSVTIVLLIWLAARNLISVARRGEA